MTARALVVVPTYNERENLSVLVGGLLRHENVRVLIVDDQSPDGTGQVADELAGASAGRVRVLHRQPPRGYGRSCLDGLRLAIAEPVDVVCQMDADLSHDPAAVPRLLTRGADADLVIGSRYAPGGRIENWPKRRLLLRTLRNHSSPPRHSSSRTLTGRKFPSRISRERWS